MGDRDAACATWSVSLIPTSKTSKPHVASMNIDLDGISSSTDVYSA